MGLCKEEKARRYSCGKNCRPQQPVVQMTENGRGCYGNAAAGQKNDPADEDDDMEEAVDATRTQRFIRSGRDRKERIRSKSIFPVENR